MPYTTKVAGPSSCRFVLFSPLLLAVISVAAQAAEPKVKLLWPQGAPGAKGDQPADKPTLTVFLIGCRCKGCWRSKSDGWGLHARAIAK